MDIREIRVDQFGCWQDVTVHSLPIGLNLIHLDDGGQPCDFARFLFGVLFGFENHHKTAAGGAIVLDDGKEVVSIDRQISSQGSSALRAKQNGRLVEASEAIVQQAQAFVDPRIAGRFFIPVENNRSTNWTWLASQPELLNQLMDELPTPRIKRKLPPMQQPPVSKDSAIRQWQAERDLLVQQIEDRSQQLQDLAQLAKQRPVPKLTPAEVEDELRMLHDRQTPLQQALDLADKWRKWNKLRLPDDDDIDLETLRSAFAKYQASEKAKRQHQRVLTRAISKGEKKNTKQRTDVKGRDEIAVRRLLAQRDWVLRASEQKLDTVTVDKPKSASKESTEIRYAAGLVRAAQENCQAAERALRQFAAETEFDWSELEETPAVSRSEIGADSPLSDAPLSEQLEELKRRRVWIEQEYQCLLGRHSLSSQVRLWIIILFVLSIAALFGTLVVESHLWQFVLLALGLSGAASSGAIKMSLEKRAARKVHRTQDRLQQIDLEIASVAEDMWDEEEAQSLAVAREQHRLEAAELQQAVAEANRRLDSAELAFREMLISKGMSPTMSPESALQHERFEAEWNSSPRPMSKDPKLSRWVKAARKQIRKIDGDSFTEEPTELLASLDLIFAQLRNRDRPVAPVKRVRSRTSKSKRAARVELQRLEKLQRSILRRMKVHDVYELESAVEKATRRLETRREWEQLDRELSIQFDTHDDGNEIQELLEIYDATELQRRIDELDRHRSELELMRRQHSLPGEMTPATVDAVELKRDLAELQKRLATAELEIKSAIETKQRLLAEQAETLQEAEPQEIPASTPRFSFLRRLTGGRFDAMRMDNGQLSLSNRDTMQSHQVAFDTEEANLAWLALRLRLATISRQRFEQQTLPLVVLADELFGTPHDARIFEVLTQADSDGLQVLLLSGDQGIVNQLVDAGVSSVRIGLRAASTPQIENDDFSVVRSSAAA